LQSFKILTSTEHKKIACFNQKLWEIQEHVYHFCMINKDMDYLLIFLSEIKDTISITIIIDMIYFLAKDLNDKYRSVLLKLVQLDNFDFTNGLQIIFTCPVYAFLKENIGSIVEERFFKQLCLKEELGFLVNVMHTDDRKKLFTITKASKKMTLLNVFPFNQYETNIIMQIYNTRNLIMHYYKQCVIKNDNVLSIESNERKVISWVFGFYEQALHDYMQNVVPLNQSNLTFIKEVIKLLKKYLICAQNKTLMAEEMKKRNFIQLNE